MPCDLTPNQKDFVPCLGAELTFQYDRLKLILDEDHPYVKGFKNCIDIVEEFKARLDLLTEDQNKKFNNR